MQNVGWNCLAGEIGDVSEEDVLHLDNSRFCSTACMYLSASMVPSQMCKMPLVLTHLHTVTEAWFVLITIWMPIFFFILRHSMHDCRLFHLEMADLRCFWPQTVSRCCWFMALAWHLQTNQQHFLRFSEVHPSPCNNVLYIIMMVSGFISTMLFFWPFPQKKLFFRIYESCMILWIVDGETFAHMLDVHPAHPTEYWCLNVWHNFKERLRS